VNELLQTVQDNLLELVGQAVKSVPALILAIVILLITRYAVKPVRQIVAVTSEKLIPSASLRTLSVQVATVAIWVLGVLIACLVAFPDLGLGDLIGLLGLGSVAVGFAFQDIFKNFLAGILLLLNEPFRINDQIVVDQYEGTVETINIRSTAIRTYQGEQVVIPNSIVFTSPIHVLTQYESRRTDLAIGLDYTTPLPRARQVLQMALVDVDGILATPLPEVDVVGFGDSSIDFVVRYWTLPQIVYVRQTKTRVMLALKQACDEAGLNIPFPIRTVYFFDQEKYSDRYPINSKTQAN
jgi:small-conductance mechanosensitive channel